MDPAPTCTIEYPCHVEGMVTHLSLSGRAQNSGQLLLVITTATGQQVSLTGSILVKGFERVTLEHGVFAGFVSVAATAHAFGLPLRATYFTETTNRLIGLTFLKPDVSD